MASSNFKTEGNDSISGRGIYVDDFILPKEIPIRAAHTLDQLTGRFQSAKDGLPELVKNAKDQYARLHIVDREDRQILIVADTHKRNLAVIDFAGAPAENFEGWTTWSDPNAGQVDAAEDIEAGHGNGGKAFMVRGARKSAFLDSCHQGKRTKKGFVNDRPDDRYKPGFAQSSGIETNNVDEPDPMARFTEILDALGLTFQQLPKDALAAFQKRRSFTVAQLNQVNDWEGRKKPKLKSMAGIGLVEALGTHGQAAMTIETCQVWVIRDGEIVGDEPIRAVEIAPYPGFEQPLEIEIPDLLPDPETEESIKIYEAGDTKGLLRLHTSHSQMQISATMRAKNVIRIWNQRNNVATWTPQELHGIPASSFIYGELRCAALKGNHLTGATRQHLADTPLTRALREWTASQIRDLGESLHRAMAENTTPKDRERARSALSSIRELMRRFLDPEAAGNGNGADSSGNAAGLGGAGPRVPREPIEYGKVLHEILLEEQLRDVTLITGTRIPIRYRCVEMGDDGSTKPVRDVEVVLKSQPAGMFVLNPDETLTARSSGVGEIWLETPDGSVQSNRREFWTMDANDVSMRIPNEPLLQGQRLKMEITFETPDGPLDDCLIDCEVLDPTFASVGRHGRMKVGQKEGDAVVRIKFGADPASHRDFVLPIGPERVPPPQGTGDSGGDVPEILLCGEDAPGMEDFRPESRTIPGGPEYPTIIEDPLFENIVWINPFRA